MFQVVKPAPIVLILATLLGVLVHDMHIDRAASLAIALPALAVVAASATASSSDVFDKYLSTSYHTQIERPSIPRSFVTFHSSLPNTQPAREDSRRYYVQNKKAQLGFGDDQGYSWPSA